MATTPYSSIENTYLFFLQQKKDMPTLLFLLYREKVKTNKGNVVVENTELFHLLILCFIV